MHHYQDLITLFNQCFATEYNTRLIKGEDEPIYLPASEACSYHAIYFANGYFSSALHECSHWFIAGPARRNQTDYGYWYAPDGRSEEQQALFQVVEVKPQAIEWILSDAAHYPFQLSLDNLNAKHEIDAQGFRNKVYQQVLQYRQEGLPKRANQFLQVLSEFYGYVL